MIACAKCQRSNEDHYKFCLGCGSPLVAQAPTPAPAAESIACPQCASRIAAGQRFCSSCGFRVPDNELAPQQAPSPSVSAAPAPATQPESPISTQHGQSEVVDEPAAAPASTDAAPSLEEQAPPVESAPPAVAPQEPSASSETRVVGRLVMVNPDGSPGDSVELVTGDNVIGRSSPAPVLQRDEFLSPEHAVFRIADGGIEIEDRGSVNGVFFRTAGPIEIVPGDVLRLGQEVLHFQSLKDFPVDPELSTQVGSSLGSVWGRVARISGPKNDASTAFLLWKDEHTIGRERGDFTFPDDGFVSGLHARIFRKDGHVYVEDLKSSNGTYLKIKGSRVVPNGALLLLGKQPFRVQLIEA